MWVSEGEVGAYVEAGWEAVDLERLESDPADLELPESELLELLESGLLELLESELPEAESPVPEELDALAASRSFLRPLALLPWSFL